MKATRDNFKKLMNSLDVNGIKEALIKTWNDEVGGLFREVGFEVLDERLGEEESDRIYCELWNLAKAA